MNFNNNKFKKWNVVTKASFLEEFLIAWDSTHYGIK